MYRLTSLNKWHVLGLIGVLALGMLAATVIAGALVSSQAVAHGGDTSLVHACVNQTNAEVRIAHPGPGDAATDCTALGAAWMNVHLDEDWPGAGTGSMYNLTDDVGIGIANPGGALHILKSGAPPAGLPEPENGLLLGINGTASYKWIQSYGGALSLNPQGNNVGIGTTAPATKLHIGAGDLRIDAGQSITFGTDSVAVSENAGTLVMKVGGTALTLSEVGVTAQQTSSFDVVSGNLISLSAGGDVLIDAGDNVLINAVTVGIGESNPSQMLEVNGNALADAHVTPSSRRWKTNIWTIDDALGTVQQLRGVTYEWKASGRKDIGLIAEEVGTVVPEVVQDETNGVDALSLDYSKLVRLLIEAIKEQQQEIESLKAAVANHVEP